MKKFLTTLLIVASCSINTFAQGTGYSVAGSTSVKNAPAENVSISLLKASDSAVVKMQLSDKSGKFIFSNVAAGTYILSITGVGVKPYTSAPVLVDKDVTLPAIELKSQSKVLGEVTVTARKPLLEMKADKMVVNVDASPTNAGNTALDVLEKSPGVTVDKDGNISLKGKQGVMVYIDGKPSYVSGSDLANMLKGMNASQLDQIEIMTNPPAKYDAAGNSGIINIKTKKSKTVGFNGSVNAGYGQGVYPKANAGLNLNYRRNKFNLFGSFGYNYRGGFQEFQVDRNILNQQTNAIAFRFRQSAFMPDTRNTRTTKLGLDYDFSKRTSASISMNTFNTVMTYDNNTANQIFDHSGDLQTTNYGRTYMTPNVSNYTSNFNLQHKFDSAGTEVVFNADYISYNDKHKQQFFNSFYNAAGALEKKPDTLYGNLPSGFKVYAAKVDFTRPLKNNAKLELGAKTSYVSSDNDIRFDSLINNAMVKDVNRTNHFIYKENVYAGYINFSSPIGKKINVQAGLRYEYTDGRGHSLTTGAKFNNTYGQYFPTLYLSYNATENHTFNINYGRRITRPQYRDLNPFIFIIDRYTNQRGNPYLQPQFGHNVELSHSYKNWITSTLNYSQVDGAISEVVETNEATKEVSLVKKNIAKQQQVGLAINISKPLNNWLTLTFNSNFFHNRYKGVVQNVNVDLSTFSANFYGALQFKFKKGWDAEINGFYNSPGIDGVSENGSMGMFSLAASKEVLNKKGKLVLNIRDPFALQRYTGTTRFSTVDATINSRWDNRIVNLSFNYRFGKMFSNKKRSSGSAAEEQSRIGG